MTAVTALPGLIAAYAERFHRALPPRHHVVSPLGAWLVLALAAPAAGEDLQGALAEVLGCPVDEGAATARSLLAEPHPAVGLAAAAWGVTPQIGGDVGKWARTLGPDVETGPVPDQAGVDAWATRHTYGLIEHFPLAVRGSLLVLASAIATRISWQRPFLTVPAERTALPRADGFAGVQNLLHDDGFHSPCVQAIASGDLGLLGVHAAPSRDDDLVVVSVIAEAGVPVAEVLAAAHPIAIAVANGQGVPDRVSLFDLPLEAGHAWTLTEDEAPGPDQETYRSTLPAWSAQDSVDLMATPELGFRVAGEALRRLVLGASPEARQVAMARYTRTGFEAAAVTGLAVPTSAMRHERVGRRRSAALEFTRPFAVVAAARDQRPGSPWQGTPVFSGWVARGDETDADEQP